MLTSELMNGGVSHIAANCPAMARTSLALCSVMAFAQQKSQLTMAETRAGARAAREGSE
jgi:hypothetical protein